MAVALLGLLFVGTLWGGIALLMLTAKEMEQNAYADARSNGEALFARRDFDAAIPAFTDAIRLRPADARANERRAKPNCIRANLTSQSPTARRRSASTQILATLMKPVAATTTRVTLTRRLVISRRRSRWSVRSVLRLTRQCLQEEGAIRSAISDYTQAIQLGPEDAVAYLARAFAFERAGRWDEALKDYAEVIRLNPSNGGAYELRGCARKKRRDLDGAIEDFSEALRLNPANYFTYFSRGLAWCGKAEYAKAVADFDQVIRLRPHDGKALYMRGVAYQNMGEAAKAKMDFARADKLGYKPEEEKEALPVTKAR